MKSLPCPARSYLVLRWDCSCCGHVNYSEGKNVDTRDADIIEEAEALGCEPSDLATIAPVQCCRRCETAHDMTRYENDG